MKKPLALLIVAALFLVLTVVPAYSQPADQSLGQTSSFLDACVQLFAITNAFFHVDHQPRWTNMTYSLKIFYALPKALPSAAESRAPPA